MRSKMQILLLLVITSLVFAGTTLGSDVFIYPNKGQSQKQQDQDKSQCYSWAKKQTGFDPMKTPTATSAPPPKEKEVWGAGKTGVAGAATGAIVGGVASGRKGAGRGALIGGAGGALLGGMRRSSQRNREDQNRQQWEREQVNNYTRARNEYNRAFAACMTGRGYTVK